MLHAILIGGNHVGEVSTLKEIETKRSSMPNEITFEEGWYYRGLCHGHSICGSLFPWRWLNE